jgi:hypothetical protein
MNPFIQAFPITVIEKNQSYSVARTTDIVDGIITKSQKVTDTVQFDQQSKCSVYYIPYIENVLFKELKSNARDLLLYIIYNIKSDIDFINLKQDKVCKEMFCSKPTLISSIKQLSDVAILCKKSQSEYWVNPHYIFKGNRIKFYTNYYPAYINLVHTK